MVLRANSAYERMTLYGKFSLFGVYWDVWLTSMQLCRARSDEKSKCNSETALRKLRTRAPALAMTLV